MLQKEEEFEEEEYFDEDETDDISFGPDSDEWLEEQRDIEAEFSDEYCEEDECEEEFA
ncbi:MAG: hypothetical protein QXW80_02880 [Candidatus Micrarchaeia archaeon]